MTNLAMVDSALNLHDLLWRHPMTYVGWHVAAYFKRRGVKGVGRRSDFSTALAMLDERVKAAANG